MEGIELQPESFCELVEVTVGYNHYATLVISHEPNPLQPVVTIVKENSELLPEDCARVREWALLNSKKLVNTYKEVSSYTQPCAFEEELGAYYFTVYSSMKSKGLLGGE